MTHRNAFDQGKNVKIRCFLLMQQNVLYTDKLFLIFVEHGCEKYAQTLCFTVVGCCYPVQGCSGNNQTKYYSHCCWWFGKIISMHLVHKNMVMYSILSFQNSHGDEMIYNILSHIYNITVKLSKQWYCHVFSLIHCFIFCSKLALMKYIKNMISIYLLLVVCRNTTSFLEGVYLKSWLEDAHVLLSIIVVGMLL